MTADESTEETANTSELTGESAAAPTPAKGRLLSLALLVTLLIAGICALLAIAWFTLTEPDKPSIVPATPTAAQSPEDQSVGFRGDPRSPSQIIRAARRAQERAMTTPNIAP